MLQVPFPPLGGVQLIPKAEGAERSEVLAWKRSNSLRFHGQMAYVYSMLVLVHRAEMAEIHFCSSFLQVHSTR